MTFHIVHNIVYGIYFSFRARFPFGFVCYVVRYIYDVTVLCNNGVVIENIEFTFARYYAHQSVMSVLVGISDICVGWFYKSVSTRNRFDIKFPVCYCRIVYAMFNIHKKRYISLKRMTCLYRIIPHKYHFVYGFL